MTIPFIREGTTCSCSTTARIVIGLVCIHNSLWYSSRNPSSEETSLIKMLSSQPWKLSRECVIKKGKDSAGEGVGSLVDCTCESPNVFFF